MTEEQAPYGNAEEEALVGSTKESFKNLREVTEYLRGQGWKVAQSTVYKHENDGKIRPEADGSYGIKSVLKYARSFLLLKSTKEKLDDEALQRKKTMAEIRRIDEQAKLARIKRMVEEGRYILKEQFELELAARAAALEAALLFMVQSKVGNWIRIVSGDFKRTQDLISDFSDAVNDTLNEFASLKEFHVLFAINAPGEKESDDAADGD